jgi:hypothetical protein
MDRINAFMACEDIQVASSMWSEMFLSLEIAVAVINNANVVLALITKAFKVQLPWTTNRCALRVERLTGAAMVATTDEYNAAFLYSIALGCEMDPRWPLQLKRPPSRSQF